VGVELYTRNAGVMAADGVFGGGTGYTLQCEVCLSSSMAVKKVGKRGTRGFLVDSRWWIVDSRGSIGTGSPPKNCGDKGAGGG
jgi:hypothetical protein